MNDNEFAEWLMETLLKSIAGDPKDIRNCTDGMEAVDQSAQKLKGNEPNLQVSEISLGTKKNCYCCGSEQHRPRECPYREEECQSCKKKGHLARMCQSRPMQDWSQNFGPNKSNYQPGK